MPKIKEEYVYNGPVSIPEKNSYREKVSSYKWIGKTRASSPKEAISNLKCQYRRESGMNTHVPLIMRMINLKKEGTS